MAQNLVKLLMPVNSKVERSIKLNDAQNSDWDVSNKLQQDGKTFICNQKYTERQF